MVYRRLNVNKVEKLSGLSGWMEAKVSKSGFIKFINGGQHDKMLSMQ